MHANYSTDFLFLRLATPRLPPITQTQTCMYSSNNTKIEYSEFTVLSVWPFSQREAALQRLALQNSICSVLSEHHHYLRQERSRRHTNDCIAKRHADIFGANSLHTVKLLQLFHRGNCEHLMRLTFSGVSDVILMIDASDFGLRLL